MILTSCGLQNDLTINSINQAHSRFLFGLKAFLLQSLLSGLHKTRYGAPSNHHNAELITQASLVQAQAEPKSTAHDRTWVATATMDSDLFNKALADMDNLQANAPTANAPNSQSVPATAPASQNPFQNLFDNTDNSPHGPGFDSPFGGPNMSPMSHAYPTGRQRSTSDPLSGGMNPFGNPFGAATGMSGGGGGGSDIESLKDRYAKAAHQAANANGLPMLLIHQQIQKFNMQADRIGSMGPPGLMKVEKRVRSLEREAGMDGGGGMYPVGGGGGMLPLGGGFPGIFGFGRMGGFGRFGGGGL